MFPKIRLGKETTSHGFFDLSQTYHTTSDFGFCQPYFSKLMLPSSSLTVKPKCLVRLMPMPYPTMGNLQVKMYNVFVPIADLCESFEPMMSEKPYTSQSGSTYTPNKSPYFTMQTVLNYVLSAGSDYTVYKNGGAWSSDAYKGKITPTNLTLDTSLSTSAINTALSTQGYSLSLTKNPKTSTASQIAVTGADMVLPFVSGSNYYLIAFRYNNIGDKIQKIFNALGFQLNSSTDELNALPIFAYYKAWFDLFYPQREITWTNTMAYKMLQSCLASNNMNIFGLSSANTTQFFTELTQCYYTFDPDYISAHILNPSLQSGTSTVPFFRYDGTADSITIASAQQPRYSVSSGMTNIDAVRLKLLTLATKVVNKNTAIGGRIDDYLRVHYGAIYQHNLDSKFIGSCSVPCEIQDVMCNSDTYNDDLKTGDRLGAFAGRGIGSNWQDPDTLKFSAQTFGYWIGLFAIVPHSGYCQATHPDNYMVQRLQYPQPIYDAVGFESTNKNAICGATDSYHLTQFANGFGFIPRYTGHKIAYDRLGGNFAKRSTRASFLPYTLNRLITQDYTQSVGIKDPQEADLVASTSWRYCNKDKTVGAYSRIFYNDTEYNSDRLADDNFVVSFGIDVKYSAPLKSISTSFDTDGDLDSIEVTKA